MASRLTTFIVAIIVVGTVIAGLIVGAQRDDATGPIDLIITNGRVYTGSATEFAEAVAVRGNKVLLVGSNREIKRLRRPQTTMIDAHGASVLAGFNDASLELLRGGRTLAAAVDLFGARTLSDVETRVRDFAAAHAEEPWVRGRGWHYQPLPGAVPARQQLDALVPDRPAFLRAHDGRTGWANSKALQLAGITRRTPNPPDGVIVKDPRTGEPTGVLRAGAMQLVENVLPEADAEALRQAARAAVDEAHRVGVTSVQHLAGGIDDLQVLSSLRSAGELNVRVYVGLLVGPGFSEADADALDRIRAEYPDDPLFKAGAVTLRLRAGDAGPASGRSARQAPAFPAAELDRIVALLDARGWQVVVRAGDRQGVRMAIDAFERAVEANPAPPRGRRHRVEHGTAIDDADMARLVALGVVVSQRPSRAGLALLDVDTWAASRQRDADMPWPILMKVRAAGGRVVFGSDWPLAVLDPLWGLDATLASAQAGDAAPEHDEESPLLTALEAYTTEGAWSTFDEQRKGRLERDMLADIVILTGDIFRPGARLRDVVVDKTVFDGRLVYVRPTPPDTTD